MGCLWLTEGSTAYAVPTRKPSLVIVSLHESYKKRAHNNQAVFRVCIVINIATSLLLIFQNVLTEIITSECHTIGLHKV